MLTNNSDAAFAFDIHAIEILRAHVALFNNFSDSEHAIGECGFAVIDMRDDAEITNLLRFCRRRLRGFGEFYGRHLGPTLSYNFSEAMN